MLSWPNPAWMSRQLGRRQLGRSRTMCPTTRTLGYSVAATGHPDEEEDNDESTQDDRQQISREGDNPDACGLDSVLGTREVDREVTHAQQRRVPCPC